MSYVPWCTSHQGIPWLGIYCRDGYLKEISQKFLLCFIRKDQETVPTTNVRAFVSVKPYTKNYIITHITRAKHRKKPIGICHLG